MLFLNIYRVERFARTRVCAGRYSDKDILRKNKVLVGSPLRHATVN